MSICHSTLWLLWIFYRTDLSTHTHYTYVFGEIKHANNAGCDKSFIVWLIDSNAMGTSGTAGNEYILTDFNLTTASHCCFIRLFFLLFFRGLGMRHLSNMLPVHRCELQLSNKRHNFVAFSGAGKSSHLIQPEGSQGRKQYRKRLISSGL